MKYSLASNYSAIIIDLQKLIGELSNYVEKVKKSYGFGDEFEKIKKILKLREKIDKSRADFFGDAQLKKDYVAVAFDNK